MLVSRSSYQMAELPVASLLLLSPASSPPPRPPSNIEEEWAGEVDRLCTDDMIPPETMFYKKKLWFI